MLNSIIQTDLEVSHSSVVGYDFYGAYTRPIQSDSQAYLSETSQEHLRDMASRLTRQKTADPVSWPNPRQTLVPWFVSPSLDGIFQVERLMVNFSSGRLSPPQMVSTDISTGKQEPRDRVPVSITTYANMKRTKY